MIYSFKFYETDESFDYADWYAPCTCCSYLEHGFEIDIDKDDKVDIKTLHGFNDFWEMNKIKTLPELKQYIVDHIHEVQEDKDRECLEELVDFITCQISREMV